MRTHISFRWLTLAGSVLFLGAALQAQGWGQGAGQGLHQGRGRGGYGMTLTAAQQSQVQALRDQHQAALKAKGAAAQQARQDLRAAMAKADTETATLKNLHDQVAAAQFELLLERRAMRQQMLPLLTPEQKAQMEARRAARGQGGPRGNGSGHRRGGRLGQNPQGPCVQPS